MRGLVFGSVCSGIEAASVAWEPLGWRAAFFAEIEPFPAAVLRHHWPEVPNYGDMTRFKDWPDHSGKDGHDGKAEPDGGVGPAIDVLVGGTPCQSFSVAGLRKGLDDPRGNLALTFLAIAARYRPRWVVWENVPGVLSSGGGRDFGAFLGGLGQLGYGWAYRVLDAQYFGVAQRRRRVFVVGHLGDERCAQAVLFERESLRGDTPPRREAGQGTARSLAAGTEGSGGYRNDADTVENVVVAGRGASGLPVPELRGGECGDVVADVRMVRPRAFGGNRTGGEIEVAPACNAHGGPNGRQDFESEAFVVTPPLTQNPYADNESREGLLVSEPYTLAVRGRGDTHSLEFREDGVANAVLTPNGGRAGIGVGAVAFKASHYTRDKDGAPDDVAPPLSADADKGDQDTLIAAYRTSANNGAWETGERIDALTTGSDRLAHPLAFSITPSNSNKDYNAREVDRAQAVTTQGGAPSARGGDVVIVRDRMDTGPMPAIAFSGRDRGDDGRGYGREPNVSGDVAGALDTVKPDRVADMGGGRAPPHAGGMLPAAGFPRRSPERGALARQGTAARRADVPGARQFHGGAGDALDRAAHRHRAGDCRRYGRGHGDGR